MAGPESARAGGGPATVTAAAAGSAGGSGPGGLRSGCTGAPPPGPGPASRLTTIYCAGPAAKLPAWVTVSRRAAAAAKDSEDSRPAAPGLGRVRLTVTVTVRPLASPTG